MSLAGIASEWDEVNDDHSDDGPEMEWIYQCLNRACRLYTVETDPRPFAPEEFRVHLGGNDLSCSACGAKLHGYGREKAAPCELCSHPPHPNRLCGADHEKDDGTYLCQCAAPGCCQECAS